MTNQDLQADLAKVAAEYNHSVLQQAVLENYKDSILLLRAKAASFEKITQLLNDYDLKVSVATVRKFCIKYRDETNRLRAEMEADAKVKRVESAPVKDEQRPSLTGDPGKRGPRPARDQL